MKIHSVRCDNRRRAFEVAAGRKKYWFPYAKLAAPPSRENPVATAYVDDELGKEGFTYQLKSGQEGTVHIDQVLDYNRDPRYLRDMLLYKLTLEAQERVKTARLSKRELIRRLKTSPAQLYRLLDQTNYAKSIDQMIALLGLLGCEVGVAVTNRPPVFGASSVATGLDASPLSGPVI